MTPEQKALYKEFRAALDDYQVAVMKLTTLDELGTARNKLRRVIWKNILKLEKDPEANE